MGCGVDSGLVVVVFIVMVLVMVCMMLLFYNFHDVCDQFPTSNLTLQLVSWFPFVMKYLSSSVPAHIQFQMS